MEKLLEQINDRIAAFQKDAYLQWFKGNKAAGRRARKAALELMALLKEFRKASREAGREIGDMVCVDTAFLPAVVSSRVRNRRKRPAANGRS